MIEAKVIAHSAWQGKTTGISKIATMQLRYPRFIHSEFMTHRDFSRNASSSRATPISKLAAQLQNDCAMPVEWGLHQAGMQAREVAPPEVAERAEAIWREAAANAAIYAGMLQELGLHKQVVNRILEPYTHISVIVTSTAWDNFFSLRCNPDADPTMRALAEAMQAALEASVPTLLHDGDWHLPYVRGGAGKVADVMQSAAMCARVSYLTHEGTNPTRDENEALAARLLSSRHMSPFEHQCRPGRGRFFNLHNWRSFRFDLEMGDDRPYKTPFRKYTPKQRLANKPWMGEHIDEGS